MDRILIILKKENGPRASSAPALGLNTIIFKYVYWYMKQISGERLQDHWSSGLIVQPGLCRAWSEPKLLFFSCTGSYLFSEELMSSNMMVVICLWNFINTKCFINFL